MPTAPAPIRWMFGRTTWSAWIILAAALAVTAVVWQMARDQVEQAGRQRFDHEAGDIAVTMSNQVRTYAEVLRGAAGLFDVSHHVTPAAWRAYADRLELDAHYPGIESIGFVEIVPRDRLDAYVERLKAEWFPDFEITPPGERPVYAPVVLSMPIERQAGPMLGFDASSDPVSAEAMEHARDAGDVAASGAVLLEEDAAVPERMGFVLYVPIYRGGGVPGSLQARRAEIAGYLFAQFLSRDFLQNVLGDRARSLRLRVYDGTGIAAPSALFDSLASGSAGEAPTYAYSHTASIDLPQHRWTLRFDALTDDFVAPDTKKPLLVLVTGGCASILMFLLALTIARGQEQVRRSKDDLAYLFEKNPGVMWVYDRDTLQFLAINEAAIQLYGYSRDEFLQLRATDIRPSEDVPRLMDFLNTLSDGLQPGSEWRHRTRDGRIIDVAVVSHGLRFAGRQAILGLVQDITERKRARAALVESERHFRSMADSMPALLGIGETAHDMVFVNKPWIDYTGAPLDEHLGQNWYDFIHPEDVERVAMAMQAAYDRRESITVEYRLRRADGIYRWFADRGVPRFSPDGEYLGHIGVLFDTTELRDAQAQLRQSQKMEAMGQLTGGVAHDFNNLLSVILGHAELLGDRFMADDQARRSLKSIVVAASRAANLTNRLLAFSRRQQLKPEPTDVNELILEIESMLRRTIGEHIAVDVRMGEGIWPALTDPSQLEIALVNLAVNARDAMPAGGRLIIDTSNVSLDRNYAAQIPDLEPGDYALIAVIDSGEGIPPALIEKVFEPFFTTKEVGKGTGLGLSMVYGFVKQSGGHIKIYSELGIGTTVRIYLPRSAEAPARMAEPADFARPVVGGSETILVVEDDTMVRENVEAQLARLGYRVIAAPDGPAALGELRQGNPIDLLFTDVIMPGGVNGRQLAETALEIRPGLRVLFTSGYPEDVFADQGWGAMGRRILAKPYRREDLARKIRQVLDAAS